MELKQISKKGPDGVEISWALTNDQMESLINFAINELLRRGLITVIQEELEAENPDASSMSILETQTVN